MLLQAALALAPLLHNPPAPAPAAIVQESEQSLAWGVPDDALMALHWNDPKGLINNDLNNAWIAVLTDPRWIELDFWSELDVDMDDFNNFWEVAGPVLTDCTDAVAWLTGPISDTPNVYLAFRTSEDALTSLIENAPEASSRESVEGIPFIVDEDSAVGWSGDLCLVYIGEEPMEALPSLASHFQTLKTQATPAGLFETTPVGSDRNDEHFEFLMDLGAIFELIMEEEGGSEDIPEAVMDELTSIEWMYASVSFGEGQALDSNIVLPYKQDGYVAKFFEFAGEANMEAFRRVPMDAVGAVIGNLDLPGLIYWVVEEMIEAEAMTAEEFEGGLEEMEETLGFHLLEDFINNMTGELMQITFPVDDIDNEMQSMMAYTYGMLTFGMSDDEATLRALSSLMRVAEEVIEVTKDTHDWGTVWDLDVMGMFQFQIGTTAGTMFLSANPSAVDSFMAHAVSGMDTPSFYNMPGAEEIIEQLGGFQVYLYRTEAMFDSMTTLFESMLGMEDDPDMEIIADLFGAASEIAIDHLDGLIGSCASADGRIRIKTMAR